MTQKRLERGDISELEATTARIDALNAQAAAGVAAQNVPLASARLAALMGVPPTFDELRADSLVPVPSITLDTEELVSQALANRPDLMAAEWAVRARKQSLANITMDFLACGRNHRRERRRTEGL